jgi:hypothetical protein
MKKIIFFLIIFLIFCNKSFFNTNASSEFISPFCENKISQNYIENFDKLRIKKIEIDNNNYRKWTVNGIRIITNKFRFTPEKYKKRFNAKILVTYENNIQCIFKGRIRHSGDAKDHIRLQGNSIIQSLDVHLDSGHIRGITKFKLYLPGVRGVILDEILQTEILRNLNYLAPRTIKVNVRINQAQSDMMFQEKSAKELLEYHNRREGPILESDQKFFFKLVENIPDNQLSNWSVRTPQLRSKSIKAMLAKQLNPEIIFKSENHKMMSYNALTNLNLIYLYFSNKFQDQKNNFYFFDYDLDNNLLGFFIPKNILKLDIYNLLMQSTNSQHALSTSNRKFYWNSIENYFEPIVYDTNIDINRSTPTTTTTLFRLPISKQFYEAFEVLEKKLSNLNLNNIHKNLELSGINLSKADLIMKINKIIFNLNAIKKAYLNMDSEIVNYNHFKLIDNNILTKFNETLNEINPNVYLVRHNQDNGQLERCKIYLKMCEDYSFSSDNVANLLGGEFVLNKKIYQYLGKSLDFKNIIEHENYNKLKLEKATIFYDNGIQINNNIDQNLLEIYQNKPGSRIYIINGELENIAINFNGYKRSPEEKEIVPKNYPIDIKGLTGCLSLINLKVKNISIKANRANCEDAINLINVEGNINNIEIKNSLSDGLDIDFSRLEINNLDILSSLNDCLDLSYGEYKLINLNLSSCGDKGLSVGEKSFLVLNKINVNKASTGIAVKDSSVATIEYLNIKEAIKCIHVYRKKQEFSGAVANLKFVKCHDGKIEKQAGSFINRNTL